MSILNKDGMTFKGQIKSKDHVSVKERDYGAKAEKGVDLSSQPRKVAVKSKGIVKPKDQHLVKDKKVGIKSQKSVVSKEKPSVVKGQKDPVVKPNGTADSIKKTLMVKKKKARLVRRGVKTLGKAVIATSIKTAEGSEQDESTENAKMSVGKVNRTKQNSQRYMKEVGKSYQRQKHELEKFRKQEKNKKGNKKKPQTKKQRERELAVKKSRERHKGKVINRKRKASVKGVDKSKNLVKAKGSKAIKNQTAKTASKVVGKKASVKLTAGVIKGVKAKAIALKVATAVISGVKAVAGLVAMKFLIPIAVIGIALILIVAILVAVVGITASIDPAIPISEERLVTEIHVHLTELDLDWNDANGVSIRTNSSDVIALVFMGGVDPERENNEAILAEVTAFHQELHESSSGSVTGFLQNHPLLATVANDFVEFREFAFIHFYGTLGDPYERESRNHVTSHFGWRPDPFESGDRQMHNGIDIAWDGIGGVPVFATISGRVERVAYDADGYGNWVMIVNDSDPDNRKETRYAHLRSMSVTVGQRVEVGDVIGLTGTTGSSTGDHLHHEFRRNNHLLNPYFYFPNHDLEMGIGGGD